MSQVLPHDTVGEEALIGRLLVRPDVIGEVSNTIGAGDFYAPQLGRWYQAIVDAWQTGEPLDSVSLLVSCPGSDAGKIADCVAHAAAGHERIVKELVGLRIRRDVILAAQESIHAAQDLTVEPLDALEQSQQAFGAVDAPAESVRDLWYLEDFINQPASTSPWIIPGMFREGWRAIVVATEGRGKSWLSRQIAVAASAGVHPLFHSRIPPVRTLIVDLENPVDSIADAGRKMRAMAQRSGEWDPSRSFVWHRPQGIDLRRRGDRAQLEGVIARARPDFVALGPLYKAYTTRGRESEEQTASEVQQVLDDLRTRYRFALLLEHHAPKPQGGYRDILPYGSSLWLRWPELGIKLVPSDKGSSTLNVERWRADRMPNAWPQRISRGHGWPWVGEWDRTYDEAMEEVA